jgi:hypothetical protein
MLVAAATFVTNAISEDGTESKPQGQVTVEVTDVALVLGTRCRSNQCVRNPLVGGQCLWAVSLGSVFGQVFGVWQKELQAGQ